MKVLKAAAAVVLCTAAAASMGGCLKYTNNILDVTRTPASDPSLVTDYTVVYNTVPYTSPYVTQPTESVTVIGQPVTQPQTTQPTSAQPTQPTPTQPEPTQSQVTTQPAPATAAETEAAEQNSDPSRWSKAEILSFVTSAVNKSKAYTGKLTVGHKESFDVNIDNISVGGSLIKNTANQIISSVAKPTDETLTFENGKTTTSEGEIVPILLPKRQNFCLTVDGLASASASKNGSNTVINLKLVQETSSLENPAPKHNAASCGYMSISDVELPGIVTVEKLDMTYTGSTMQLTVNDKGYVTTCTYTIPVTIDGSGNVKVVSADFQVTAKIVEVWTLNW